MAIVCVAAVLAGHTYLAGRVEFGDISLVWLAGGAAILSFLVYELMDSVAGAPPHMKARQRESKAKAGVSPTGEAHRQPVAAARRVPDRAASRSKT
jgi:hypothetical protein